MDCKVFRRESEELETGERLTFDAQAHLDSCAACRTFQRERLSLRQLVGSLGTVSAPPDFDFRLRARLAAAKANGNGSFRRARFAPGLKAISVAASFALLITAAVVFKQFQSGQSNPTKNTALAKVIDAQPLRLKEAPEQLAGATHDEDVAPVNSKPADAIKVNVSHQTGGAEKIEQAKASRRTSTVNAVRPDVISNDLAFGANPPPVISPKRPAAANNLSESEADALLRVSSQPFRVQLHDRQGTMRSVSLGPVIFGSQNFLERDAQRRDATSKIEGVW